MRDSTRVLRIMSRVIANSVRASVFLTLWVAFSASAQDDVTKCTDEYSDCHDNCALRFGVSTRDDQRIKLVACVEKCKRGESDCRNRYFEAKNSGVDPQASKKDKPEQRTATSASQPEPAKKDEKKEVAEPQKKKEEPKKKAEPDPKAKRRDRSLEEWDPAPL